MEKKVKLSQLFFVFFKIGIMTFGGGMAMLPMLEHEICDKRGWVSLKDTLDFYAISQFTPGIIAVNTATFIGYSKRGVLGGIASTLGVVFPSIIIITILGTIIRKYQDNIYLIKAFAGIRIAVCALILKAVIKLIKSNKINLFFLVLILGSLALKLVFNISSTILVIIAFIIGLIFHYIVVKKEYKGSEK